jgi:xylulokinase
MMIIKGYLLKDVAARLGVPANIPVAAGSGDNMMSALGCGCTQEGRFVISLGTSGTIFTQTSKPPSVKRSSSSSSAATGYGLPLVCIQNCASVPEEVVKAYGMSRDKV